MNAEQLPPWLIQDLQTRWLESRNGYIDSSQLFALAQLPPGYAEDVARRYDDALAAGELFPSWWSPADLWVSDLSERAEADREAAAIAARSRASPAVQAKAAPVVQAPALPDFLGMVARVLRGGR